MFVTDTHSLVWYFNGKHSSLSPKVLLVFQKAENGVDDFFGTFQLVFRFQLTLLVFDKIYIVVRRIFFWGLVVFGESLEFGVGLNGAGGF